MATKYEQTHISLVLDRSGSMIRHKIETIASVNTYLDGARKDEDLKEADLELSLFDAPIDKAEIDVIRSGAPINMKNVTEDDFVPRGWTPLYDAIGHGIASLDARLKQTGSKKAILVVVTDGEENRSKEHTFETISKAIKDRQDQGWLVIFLGAGLSAAKQGLELGVRGASTASYGTGKFQMRVMSESLLKSNKFYARASADDAFAVASTMDTFSDEDREKMGDELGAKIDPAKVAEHKTQLLEGKWELSDKPIRFDKDGKLIDGQHRLADKKGRP